MLPALKAAFCYTALAFGAGFALGTLRVLVLAPVIGVVPATLLEVPMMLALSWLACGWAIRSFHVPEQASKRLIMGNVAFALLLLCETIFGLVFFYRSLPEQMAAYGTHEGAIGLMAQAVFAFFPLLHLWRKAYAAPSTSLAQ